MILAKETDRKKINDYINKKPIDNLFLIADIYQYGFDNHFQDVWYIEDNEAIKCVLLRFYDKLVLYSENQDYDLNDLKNVIDRIEHEGINLSKEDYEYVKDLFGIEYEAKFATLVFLDEKPNINQRDVFLATSKDAKDICTSLVQIEDFGYSNQKFDELVRTKEIQMNNGFEIHFCIKKDKKIVSNANTGAISNDAAVICGVFTLEEYRKRGYAKKCVSALCNFLLDNEIKPTLFFSNPIAGKMYYELGFKDCGTRVMVDKKH